MGSEIKRFGFGNLFMVVAFCAAFFSSAMLADDELEPIAVKASESSESKSDSAEAEEAAPELTEEEKEAKAKEDALDKELKQLRKQRDLISLQNSIRSEEMKAELAAMREEKDRLALENSIFREKLASEFEEAKAHIERLNSQVNTINKQIALDTAEQNRALQLELSEMKAQEERLKLELSIAQKQNERQMHEIRLTEAKLKLKRSELEVGLAELTAQLSRKEKEDLIHDQVYREKETMYLREPFVDGVLHVSDRRVALNGLIWSGLANYVSERINFYNNQSSDYPIFIVIDSSPGGSVMAGYKIMKAMQSSQAPVYVVVKSYAASTAAVIATLAERSYAYPNAILLHHQMSWGVMGNLTQQKEFLEDTQEWWRRLAQPVAEKMGLTLDEFVDKMYKENSNGDWSEFADQAKANNWIDVVVDRVWEMAVDKDPDRFGMRRYASAPAPLNEMKDEHGRSYIQLPRLDPFDFYYIYDPDNYYRFK